MNALATLMVKGVAITFLALALCACGGGGGGGGGAPPAANPPPADPPPDEPPTACTPETDALFPALVYPATDETAGVRLASSDGCRTEVIVTDVSDWPDLAGVFSDGEGFIAWTGHPQRVVQLRRFTVTGTAGAETIAKEPVETVLDITGNHEDEHFSGFDAWRGAGQELLVVQRVQGTGDERGRSLLLVEVDTGVVTDLWSMTAAAQLNCLQSAQDGGTNPITDAACVMPYNASSPSWTADGQRIYFGLQLTDQPGFDRHYGTARIEREHATSGCRDGLPDLGNGWCGPEIVHTDKQQPNADPPAGGSVRLAGFDGAPELLATYHWLESDIIGTSGSRSVVVLDANFCADLYADPARIDPLLAAGDAWRNCKYEGIPLQDFAKGVFPKWSQSGHELYYWGLRPSIDTWPIRRFNPSGVPTDGDREVVDHALGFAVLR
jgi:hypothetical protein